MARAITTLSPPPCIINFLPPLPTNNLLRLSSFSPPLKFPIHNQTNPRLSISHAQLGGSAGEELDDDIGGSFSDDDVILDDISDDDDGDDTESSTDLFIRFLQSMFKKLSKRAKKASRSILPAAISPQLVSFAVDGILLLALLSILKALLEVVCTLGSTVFVAILLVRVIWAALLYFQPDGNGSSFRMT